MQTIGLLFLPEPTPVPLLVGGISVVERQARLLRRVGVERLYAVDVVPLTVLPKGVEAVSAAALPGLIGRDDRVLVVSAGLVVDERCLKAVLGAPVPALLVADAGAVPLRGVERLDALTFAAGVMALPGMMVRDVAATLGDWDLGSTLIRAAATSKATIRIDIAALPLYAWDRRRDVPLIWALPTSDAEAKTATDIVVASAQKGCLDWPARFIHPPIEDALVRLLAPTPVTPNLVTLFTAVIGVMGIIAFAMGWLWTGLVLALITGPLDGVDGKLARTRVEFSKWGDLEHVLDKFLEYGWYMALAWYFAGTLHSALPWAVAALIILPALSEAIQSEVFRRMTGVQLDDAGDIERRIRLFAGRRNTFLWTLLPFAAAGAWFAGFVMLAVYSVATTIVAQWRFYVRLAAYGRDHGSKIAANLADSRYEFLPSGGASLK
jgi:phosphatidylglycerophosphate synthase